MPPKRASKSPARKSPAKSPAAAKSPAKSPAQGKAKAPAPPPAPADSDDDDDDDDDDDEVAYAVLDQSKLKVLPEPTRAYGAVARATEGAMAERGYTAVDLCHQLKLSKPYFSVWRNEGVKGVLSYNMPKATRALYTLSLIHI